MRGCVQVVINRAPRVLPVEATHILARHPDTIYIYTTQWLPGRRADIAITACLSITRDRNNLILGNAFRVPLVVLSGQSSFQSFYFLGQR